MADFSVKPHEADLDFDPMQVPVPQGIVACGLLHYTRRLGVLDQLAPKNVHYAIHAFKEITSPYWLNERRLRDNKIALIGEKIAQAPRVRRKP
jgi:ferredoxin/flavodoxin---NADP+ reductase